LPKAADAHERQRARGSLVCSDRRAEKGVFTERQHREALIRRRIKFVVEKGAMARLFKGGTNAALQVELSRRIRPEELARIQTRDEYDAWLLSTVESSCWAPFSRNGLDDDRWAYFAKLVNIVVYEIAANRELFSETEWERLRPFLHIPIDVTVTYHLSELEPSFPGVWVLKGMTKDQYLGVQGAARRLADANAVPPIWFEAAWSV
jgi:hypothetical protein